MRPKARIREGAMVAAVAADASSRSVAQAAAAADPLRRPIVAAIAVDYLPVLHMRKVCEGAEGRA